MACYNELKTAKAGYEAHGLMLATTESMCPWEKLSDNERRAWCAATAVITKMFNDFIIESQSE